MADNKLLGVLELNPGKVLDTINQVNSALQNLGKGVDLNLTNILNAKVNSQLKELKQQIDDINKAAATPAAGSSSGKVSQIKQINELLTQQYNAQIKLANLENRSNVNQNQINRQQTLLNEAQMRLGFYEQEKVEQQQSLSRFQNMQKRVDDARAASADRAIQMQQKSADAQKAQQEKALADEIKANQKAADEIAKQQEKAAKQKADIDKKAEQEYQKSIDAQIEAAEKAAQEQLKISQQREKDQEAMIAKAAEQANKWYDSQVENAAKLLKENADIEKKLLSGTAGPNETNELNQRLAANKQALNEYSDSIIDAAKADASVIKAQQDVAMANAQAQDRILKENQKAQEEAARAAEANAKKIQDYRKQWANYAVSALGAASLAVLKKQWTEAVDYATKYYDALNEIRIVSNDMSQQDVDQFGQKMRDLAEEMKVTSTELSEAAITFFRQGLEPAEVEDRLKWVTEYAKVAHMEFDDAAQLMTAAINTMGDSIQESGFENVVEHIADVWLYLGDNAATSGEEIGKAMQKASASAQEFGMSFEWLGTYIAVVSEQTRQAPEAIGNAFNTMMARMHQIKANGFNDEDTTKLNDVAKALATINVELMDSDGEWRDMSDIYSDIADKWGEMDAKQRGYIATTMAGTRQQNVFYALMNDLSKGIEGGSRAWELYTGAITSAGTATQKYAVYQESIAASQADMKNSLEQLYSNVMNPDMIKGFYSVITMLVDGLNNLGGVIPVVTAGIIGLGVAFKTALSFANPLVAVMAGAAAILGSLVGMGILGNAKTPDVQAARYNQAVQEYDSMSASIKKIQELQKTVNTVWQKQANGAQITSAEMARYNSALQQIAALSPNAAEAVGQLTQGLVDQEAAIKAVSQALDDESERAKARQRDAAREQLREWQSGLERSYVTVEGSDVLEELKKIGYDDTGSYESRMISLARSVFGMQDKLLLGEQTGLSDAIMETVAEYWDSVIADLDKEAAQGWRQNPDVRVDADAQEMGKRLWDKLIGDVLGGDDYQKLIEERMNDLIAHALKTVNLDNATLSQVMELREQLKDVIIGEDGILTADDLSEGVKVLIDEVLHAFEGEISGTLPNVSIAEQLAEALGMSPDDFSESFILSDKAIADDMIQSLYDFVAAGEDVDRIFDALNTSANWKEFAINMGFVKQALSGNDGSGSGEGSTKTLMSDAEALISEIKKLQGVINDIDNGKQLDISDILKIGEAHPEILALVGDVEALKTALEGLEDTANGSLREKLRSLILSQNDNLAGTPYASASAKGYTSLAQVQSYLESGGDAYKANLASFNAWLDEQVDALLAMVNAGNSANESISALESTMEKMSAIDNLEKAAETLRDLRDVGASDVLGAIQTIQKNMETLGLSVGDLPEAPAQRAEWLANVLGQIDNLVKSQHATLLETLGITEEQYQALLQQAEAEEQSKQAAEDAKKAEEERLQAYRDYLKEQKSSGEQDKASSRNYSDQISYLRNMFRSRGSEGALTGWESLGNLNKEVQTAVQNTFPRLATVLAKIATSEGDAAANAKELDAALSEAEETVKKLTEVDQAKYFKETAGELKELITSGGDYTDALEAFTKEEEIAMAAQEEFNKIVEEGGVTAETTVDDVANLSKALGWDANSILKNWERIGPLMEQLGVDMEAMRASLQKEIFLSLVGTSTADFSAIQEGLMSVENMAQSTIDALVATGQFEVVRKWMEEGMEYQTFDPTGNIITTTAKTSGFVDVIVPTGGTVPTKPQGAGGGGGGGGGGNKQKTTSASTKALDRMERIQTLQDHTRSLYSAQAGYYEQTGQIDLVIKYHQKEMEAIRDKNATLEENIAELEDWIAKKREEIAALDEASEEYETAQKELDALEDRHREYTLAVIENKTELESLQEAIKELNNEVRDMQIDLYDEVVAALEARDAAAQERLEGTISVQEAILGVIQDQADAMDDMLSHRVNMENTILGIIKAQADAERNMLSAVVNAQNTIASMIKSQADAQKNMMQARSNMENTLSNLIKTNIEAQASAESDYSSAADDANQAQIEALRQQKELLDEQLRLRKEMAEAQDKQAELAELEAQYARISADPTRLKEAMKIRQKIDKIRDEIAWDIAEKEVEEQKKAIDEQIDALSASTGGGGSSSSSSSVTYNMDEVNSQVESILDTMSDEEIIEWLKDHSPDYKEATKIGKELMVQEWQAALNEMHGISEDYADEVAEVMAMSDAEMMEWFKKTSLEYQTATAERRMQLEAEWQEMLDEMHGKTETYAEEVAEVLNKPRQEILQWLMENDEEYAHASDAQKQELVDGWNETLDGMYGTSQDHWDQVNAIMAGGLESFLNFMRTNDEEYAKMSAEQKQKTEQEWTDMWNQMIGKQKSYEEEANAIIAQGQDAIIDLLGEYTTKYQNVGAQQSQAYLDEWMEKLAKLKAAISDVESLETKAYEYTQPEAASEAGGSGSEKAEEAKKGWRVEANWSNVFDSKAEAEAFKQSKIAAIQEQLNANPTDANLKSRLDTWKNSPINMYGKGGMNYRTGLAWLDGTPEDPERILSPYQTELFEILVHSMEEMSRVNVPMLPSFGNDFMTGGNNSSLAFGDINVYVDHLDSDTDYDDMAEHVLDSVMEKINRSAVVGGIRFSK